MQKDVQVVRALLPLLILKFGEGQVFHGYELITVFRKKLKVYFGASTIYGVLRKLEEEGLLESEWKMHSTKRPCKVFKLTQDGVTTLHVMVSTLTTTMQAMRVSNEVKPLEQLRV